MYFLLQFKSEGDPPPLSTTEIAIAVLVLVAAGFFAWYMRRRHLQQNANVTRHLVSALGMTDEQEERYYYKLSGEVDGTEVKLDIVLQNNTGSSRSRAQRPWTRVHTPLQQEPGYVAGARSQKKGPGDEQGISKSTGDETFDEKYELFVPKGADPKAVLSEKVRKGLASTQPSFHVMPDMIVWNTPGIVSEPERLEGIIRVCAQIARLVSEENS